MTAYQTRDESVESSNPVLLFQFAQGSTVYRYALASSAVVLAAEGHTWSPAVILPEEFGYSNDVGKDELKIQLAANDPLAQTFTGGAPDSITTVTIFRTFTDPETETVIYWKGRVATVGMEPGKITLNCDPIFTQLQRPGLRALYSKTCRHVLYGRGCNLQKGDFRTDVTVTAVSGTVVSLPSFSLLQVPDGYWDGGILEAPDGSTCMILKHASGRSGKLTLIRKMQSLIDYMAAHPSGAAVRIYRGCDRTYAMCKARFNNAGNFGGDPYFAQKNPFTTEVAFV